MPANNFMTPLPVQQVADDAFCCHASANPIDLVSQVRFFGLDLMQIDRGRFRASGSQTRIGGVLLGRIDFARAAVQTWTSPPRSLTIAAKTTDAAVLWRGIEIQSSDVLIIGPSVEVELVSMAEAGIAAVTFLDFSPQNDAYLRGFRACGNNAVLVRPLRAPVLNDLMMVIVTLLSCASIQPWKLGQPEWAGARRDDLLRLAALAISGAVAIEPHIYNTRRLRALELALSAMRKGSENHLDVPTLCRMAGVSERTLHNAFVERYMVPPARFLKAYRLNRLRQDLARTTSQRFPIAKIANDLGFSHLGQLARDYRDWFGELPSATHRRTATHAGTDAQIL